MTRAPDDCRRQHAILRSPPPVGRALSATILPGFELAHETHPNAGQRCKLLLCQLLRFSLRTDQKSKLLLSAIACMNYPHRDDKQRSLQKSTKRTARDDFGDARK